MKRTQQQRGRQDQQRRRQRGNQPGQIDVWRAAGPLPELAPLTMPKDPTALLRSLGEPPMHGGVQAVYHIGAVVERSAGVAAALALSVGLIELPES